ncbi:MAG TPA: DNA recombination protein RmuC [Cytophagaceae bacterium]
MEFALFSLILVLLVINILILLKLNNRNEEGGNQGLLLRLESLEVQLNKTNQNLKEDFRLNREESYKQSKELRSEQSNSLKDFRHELLVALKHLNDTNKQSLDSIHTMLDKKLSILNEQLKQDTHQLRETMIKTLKEFQEVFDRNVKSFNDLQREKFSDLEKKQSELVQLTENKLEKMRETVDEKLQKTLETRLGQSFELVTKQLESVQKGLGEMQTLAQDVGGLKKVLSNVKARGILGEIQLGNILEQIMSAEQYDTNVKIKPYTSESVEFAIKLPGREDNTGFVYLPIDAKFPHESYYSLQEAYDAGDVYQIEQCTKVLESTIKKFAKDISDKYIDPPHTTDFAIMFLPLEGLYAEVVRKTSLIEVLQKEYKVIVTGPTTLAALLNSLQMGFKTLAIQRRTSEVWKVLGAVKTEFGKFGGLLEKAQKNLHTATNHLDELVGKRTRAIQNKLKSVEALPAQDVENYLPEAAESGEDVEEES